MSTQAELRAPARSSVVDRARLAFRRWTREPNPIWVRELSQSIRRGHTPIALMLITGLVALLLCAVGGSIASFRSPAATGVTIYQTFFSLAYFVVLLLGPALAANAIVSEREGRTWEAVLLTGMRPSEIARGKFQSALTGIGLYIVALAPVGALSFLFGGVSATDVVIAFAYLFAFAILGVSFGLAVSSKMQRLGTAIVTTLLLAVAIAFTGFGTLGMGLSFAAHSLWPRVSQGHPVWLPTAYERAAFGLDYLLFLVLVPMVGLAIPAWFSYEATVANLTSDSDDRSTGLKRWFACSAAMLAVLFALVPFRASSSELETVLVVLGLYACFLGFSTFVFLGEALGPSRRVRADWERKKAGRLARFLGPGLIGTFQLVLGSGLLGLFVLTGAGVLVLSAASAPGRDFERLFYFATYAGAFFVFLSGFSALMRARASGPSAARVTTVIVVFAALVAPWLVAATAGAFSDMEGALVIAAPSPFYVGVMIDAAGTSRDPGRILAGIVASLAWASIGIACFVGAAARCRKIIQEHESRLAETDALLEAEDRAMAEALAAMAAGAREGAT